MVSAIQVPAAQNPTHSLHVSDSLNLLTLPTSILEIHTGECRQAAGLFHKIPSKTVQCLNTREYTNEYLFSNLVFEDGRDQLDAGGSCVR